MKKIFPMSVWAIAALTISLLPPFVHAQSLPLSPSPASVQVQKLDKHSGLEPSKILMEDKPSLAQQLDEDKLDKASKSKKRASKKDLKKELREETDALPILTEISKLKWEIVPQQSESDDTKKIGLEKIFEETLGHNIVVRQAEVQIKDTEAQAKEIREPGLFNLLNPIDIPALKKAAESNVQAAKAHLRAVRQKALLESARMYGELTQAFLEKYLAYQAIEQGRNQLKAEQERFVAGETNRFDVTQTQMALVDRYGKYLTADNLYHTTSLVLSNQISASREVVFVPEGIELQDQNATVPLLRRLPDDLNLETVLRAVKNRPDGQEVAFRKSALQSLIKAASGLERQKKQAELHQMELEIEKATNAGSVMAEKAYNDYLLSKHNLALSQQRFDLASRFVEQLHISHQAGFSSAKDILDGQIELAKVKTGLIGAQVTYNLSQIQLLYEMGLLEEDVLSRPLVIPPNLL